VTAAIPTAHRPALFLVRLLVLAVALAPLHARADSTDDDFRFASGLVDLGFSDYAQKVVDAVLRLHPELADRANLVKAEGMIAARKFADAEALLGSMGDHPKADAIRLALARGYYRSGQTDKAKALYDAFFGKFKDVPSDADLLRFYQEAAYQYGQMLDQAGDALGAIQSYGRVIATKPAKGTVRSLLAEQAQLYIRLARNDAGKRDEYLGAAQKLCDEVQWGGVDVFFGQSIISMANIQLVRGDREKAKATIKQYNDILKEIDKAMKEQGEPMALNPMAGCRFLLGEINQQQAEAIQDDGSKRDEAVALFGQALNEFYNVFVQYGESDWGPEAGVRANDIKQVLEKKFGKQVKIDLGAMADEAVKTQFRLADNLYRQKNYAQAVVEYLKPLNAYPEAGPSLRALGTLLMAYAEMGDTLMVKALTGYIAERFSQRDEGAVALLAVAKYYLDKGDADMYAALYEAYLAAYPRHEMAAQVLYTLAGIRKKGNDTMGATAFYERIVKGYPKNQYYPKALTQLAWIYYQAGNYAKAEEGFRIYVRDTQPSTDQAQAQYNLADCLIRLEKFPEAVAEFEKLIGWLGPKDNPYSTTPEGAAKNKKLLERAVFQRANCYARLAEPAAQVPAFREKALKGYETFVSLFPQSELAPTALSGKGTVLLGLNRFDEAAKAFDEVAAKYPNSPEGKNALYSLARSAMEIKQFDQAKAAFAKMMAGAANYSPDEFLRIGQLMIDAGLNEQAAQAFAEVSKSTQERALLERALFGTGKAQFGMKNYAEAVKQVEDMMTRYPKSALFFDAKFILGESYRELGRLDEATAAFSEVFRYSTDNVLISRANVELGKLQMKQGDLTGALGAFQRVALLADAGNKDVRPMIEQAIFLSIDVAKAQDNWGQVAEYCDQFLNIFPESARVEEVRRMKADARLKASEKPAAPAQPAGPTGGGK
jgi:tetratricopeptide (TPR) repeat protein